MSERPDGGEDVIEVIPCAGTPYRCDGFDPADWPEGEVPDFSLIREWERGAARQEASARRLLRGGIHCAVVGWAGRLRAVAYDAAVACRVPGVSAQAAGRDRGRRDLHVHSPSMADGAA